VTATLRRFAALGLVATVADVATFVVLRDTAGWPLVAADAVALVVAALASFVLHRTIARPGDPYERWVERPGVFVRVAVGAALVDLAVLVLLDRVLEPDTALALVGVKLAAVVVAGLARMAGARRFLVRSVRDDLDRPVDRPPAPGDVRLSVVVPAFGEETRIEETVAALRDALTPVAVAGGVEVIVVDDGSTDATARAAESAGADQVIRFSHNRGKGAAVRAGVLAAHGRTVVFTDADLSYAPDQIIALLEQVEAGWDVVVGSRRHTDTTTLVRAGRLRELGGRAINLLTHAVLLGQYRDTQCGLKAFRSDVARLLFSQSRVDGFAFDVELFHLAERHRLSLTEVPVRVANSSRSTVRVVRHAAELVRDLFRVRRWGREGVYDADPSGATGRDLPAL
jgi:putative flippase GtrA